MPSFWNIEKFLFSSLKYYCKAMEDAATLSVLHYLSIIPLLSQLISTKFEKISYLISFIYLMVLAKLRIRSLNIKSIDSKYFEDLISQNKYEFNFIGDIKNCALLSINTLIALSVTNKSWLKISQMNIENNEKLKSENNNLSDPWKIKMPPVKKKEYEKTFCNVTHYNIQCICVSSVPKDFVLYVTESKMFNISKLGKKEGVYYDAVTTVKVEKEVTKIIPQIATAATVAAIFSSCEISSSELDEMLGNYFKEPKLLKVNEIFQIEYNKCSAYLKLKMQDFCFKVVEIRGKYENQDYYILKDQTAIYLDPPVHSYLPQRNSQYISNSLTNLGFTIPFCPYGLTKYYQNIRSIFKPFLKSDYLDIKSVFLLSGPRGSGKKLVLKCVAKSYGLHFIQVNCFDIYGLSPPLLKGKLLQIFAKARKTLPCIIYLENVELLGREQNHHENPRLLYIFENLLNEQFIRKPLSYPLLIVGSTTLKPSEILPGIARLFIQTINFELLKYDEVYQILRWLLKSICLIFDPNDLAKVAEKVSGFVFADLVLLVQHAFHFQIQDVDQMEIRDPFISIKHFDAAIELMEAAYSKSLGVARVPKVHWEDIGGLIELKEEIILTLNLPLTQPGLLASGLKRSGIMFYGPPGTGKTLMAKAIATECNYKFLSVKGPELMNMYVGQSEKNVREVFEKAREAAPCIIFFDELDSLAPSRGKSGDSAGVTDRVVSQLLAEMDGLEKNKDVFVIAATNRPDLVDPALLRPGRFDKMYYVGICNDKQSKLNILKALTKRFCLANDVTLEDIAEQLPGKITGADLYSVCSNAWFAAAREAVKYIETEGVEVPLPLTVSLKNFNEAINQFVPSLTAEDLEYYDKLKISEKR